PGSSSAESSAGPAASTPGGRLLGLDCEMVQTAKGFELARATLVDERRHVLLDEHVRPMNRVTDHMTKWSGITAETLAACSVRIEQVQVAMLRLVRSNDILVGHSLENDLRALKMVHRRCIDTSLLYPHHRPPRKTALRVLVQTHLGRAIQQESPDGHSSEQDAAAALELAQLKIRRGPHYGVDSRRVSVFESVSQHNCACYFVGDAMSCQRY
ncbi:unnamed protein product, partial [Phaeothamnion confervicola]